jgi:hypothetical protein
MLGLVDRLVERYAIFHRAGRSYWRRIDEERCKQSASKKLASHTSPPLTVRLRSRDEPDGRLIRRVVRDPIEVVPPPYLTGIPAVDGPRSRQSCPLIETTESSSPGRQAMLLDM